ncbi:hypothetical protein [Streptomyces sp. NPDC005303]|uniref:hypothetical protein n=1 Tax=Streptomyces sp. NPDC005303 TaxID=3155713 RepID=UPI0033B9B190
MTAAPCSDPSPAEHHLNDIGTDRPAWWAWVSEADLAVDSGQALLDLGDTSRAHQLISSSAKANACSHPPATRPRASSSPTAPRATST